MPDGVWPGRIRKLRLSSGYGVIVQFSHAIVVTGSRSWSDRERMCAMFNEQWARWKAESGVNPRPVLIHGGAKGCY